MEKKKGKKKWIILAVILIVIAVVVGSCSIKAKKMAASLTDYTKENPEERDITKTLSGSGSLKPANSYTVTTLVEGDILEADFEVGDIVEKNTILYRIDDSDASKNIERSQISYNQSKRSYDNTVDKQYIKAGAAGQIVSLDVKAGDEITQGQKVGSILSRDQMTIKVPFPSDDAKSFSIGDSAEVTLDSTFETLQGIVTEISGADIVGNGNMLTRNVTVEVTNPGGLTDSQAATVCINGLFCSQPSTFKYKASSSLTALASGTVAKINAPEGSYVEKDDVVITLGGDDFEDLIQNAQDSLRTAQLSMESTKDQLDNYNIESPIYGTIVDKQYKKGDTVSAGKVLCTIYDLSYLEITLNIDELDIMDMAVGQQVEITADAAEGKSFKGEVTKVSVAGSTMNGTTSYPVTVRIDDTNGLLPGMNVNLEIIIATAKNALSVPNDAVQRGDLVMITSDSPSAKNAEENKAPDGYVYVKVETGLSDSDYVEIKSGLTKDDTIAYIPADNSAKDLMTMMMNMAGGGGGNMGGGNMGGRGGF